VVDQLTDIDALVRAARECPALRHGAVLAEWVGAGRPVTAKRVLRRADIPHAGRMLGVALPGSARSAADLPALHHPWTAAGAIGLLSISGGRAVTGPALVGWRSAADEEVLRGWSRGLAAVLAETFVDDADGAESLEIGRLVLTALATDPPPAGADVLTAITQAILGSDLRLHDVFFRGSGVRDPAEVALEACAAFGAVTGGSGQWRVTPLGRWALPRIGGPGFALPEPAGARIPADAVCQLKIVLRYVRPACWRRVLVPASATLGDLHEVIQVAFAWDDDHLHAFTIGRRQYGDPYFEMDYDEDKITLATAFARARKPISYLYDFGDNWQHDIMLERTVDQDQAGTCPICVDGRGDAPVEDCGEDEPAWIPFDQDGINSRLAHVADGERQLVVRLREDIEIILTDAYGARQRR
jgi:pRiA4b ORF-3-like protein